MAVKVSTRAKAEAKFSDAKAAAMSAMPPEEEEVKRRVSVLVVDDSSVSSRVATKKLEKVRVVPLRLLISLPAAPFVAMLCALF